VEGCLAFDSSTANNADLFDLLEPCAATQIFQISMCGWHWQPLIISIISKL
jgi:hypothetical protein